jgi:archaellum component FlaC
MPQMSEERFDRIDATLQKLGARFDAVDARFDAVDKRLGAFDKRFEAMDNRFDGMDNRFDAMDKRFDRLEVLHEETRGKVDQSLENTVATNERLDRFEGHVNKRFDILDQHVRMVLDNHEARIHDLEQG